MSRLCRLLTCALLAGSSAPASAQTPRPSTPTAILGASSGADWIDISPAELLVMDLQGGGRVVIDLADGFAPVHVANIRTLARDHWYDGMVVERVQDDYVTQWGDPDGRKRLPAGVVNSPPAEYEKAAAGLRFEPLPYRDTYAPTVGVIDAFPMARDGKSAWLTHCYGMVGVGRDLNPDTGTGGELYVVIGQPIRALDRNIAIVGRVVSGMEALSALPRGTGDLGFYAVPTQRLKIGQVRLAAELPPDERPRLQRLRPDSATFAEWLHARANRRDSFFLHPAGAVDVCNAMPPIRDAKP